jgi:hypothetical protein
MSQLTDRETLLLSRLKELLEDCDDLCDREDRNVIPAVTMVRARQAVHMMETRS